MQTPPRSRRRSLRVLQFIAALGLSASALAAPATPDNSLWSELRSSAQVTCPQDVALPRPLVAAAACGDRYRVLDRIMAGADLAATDHRQALAGRTALHHAAQRGDSAMAAMLLDAGADPNAADAEGNTPLHLLAGARPSADAVDLAKSLLAYGADATLTNALGRTPVKVLEVSATRTISPLRIDRSGLKTLLEQAEATGPIRTAEPSLPQRQAAVEASSDPAADASVAAEPASETAEAVSGSDPAPADDAQVASESAPADPPETVVEAPAPAPEPEKVVEAPTPAPEPETVVEAPKPAPEPARVAEAPKPAPEPEKVVEAPKPAPEPEKVVEAPKPAPEPAKVVEASKPAPAPEKAVEAPKPAPEPKDTTEADRSQVRKTLAQWAEDWSSGDPEAYLTHYSRRFVPADGNTLDGWKAQRRTRVGKPGSIRVTLTDIDVSVDGDKAIARFVQDYQSDSYKVVNTKQLTFGRESRRWRIVDERTVD
ncbi:MAG: ankyrin repeat domain-containing protein [Rhodocyclaceae bacterium]|nr:ankyrin repeat domain-containing protein [Rhodocyclaceae bacterium]